MDQFSYTSGKLSRSHLKHWIDSTFGGTGTPAWWRIGKDIEDASVNLNPDITNVKNILDENDVEDNGYAAEFDVATYYAKPGDGIYDKIKNIALNRKTGDDCLTTILEVIIDEANPTDGKYDAWTEDVVIKPQSYGGAGQSNLNIPFNITFVGNRKEGTVTITNKVPTFTAAT